jgi:hypothetical protein
LWLCDDISQQTRDVLMEFGKRIEALENGALNRPFIVPKGIGPPRNPFSDLTF